MGLYERLSNRPNVSTVVVNYGDGWWEEGCLIIPAELWPDVKDKILEIYNENQNWLYHKALEVFESVKKTKLRRQPWHIVWLYDPVVKDMSLQLVYTLRPLLFYGQNNKPYKPRKKDLLPGKWSYTEFAFAIGSLLVLDPVSRTIRWSLRGATAKLIHTELPAVVKLFDYLAGLPYVRGTGGVIRTKEGDVGFGSLGCVLLGT